AAELELHFFGTDRVSKSLEKYETVVLENYPQPGDVVVPTDVMEPNKVRRRKFNEGQMRILMMEYYNIRSQISTELQNLAEQIPQYEGILEIANNFLAANGGELTNIEN